jgi:hypothetical protein
LVGEPRRAREIRVEFKALDQLGQLLIIDIRALGADLLGPLLAPLEQHAFQPTDGDDGQDNCLIFVRPEFAAQPLRRFPYFFGKVVEPGFIQVRGGLIHAGGCP